MNSDNNLFVTFPITGTQTVTAGTLRIDFILGKAVLPNGTVIPLANRSTQTNPLQYIYFNTDKDLNVEISNKNKIVYAGLIPTGKTSIKNIIYDLVVITTTVNTEIFIAGSYNGVIE